MGYGIVLWLDHGGLDGLGDRELGGALVTAAGGTCYPCKGLDELTAGPWHRVGAWHSNQAVQLIAGAGGVTVAGGSMTGGTVVDGPELDGGGTWDRTWKVGEHAQRLRAAASGRTGAAQRELAGAAVSGAAVASVWWLYADCVGALADQDRGELGGAVRRTVGERVGGSMPVGSWYNGLNCAGRITDGPVRLYWEGNRLWDRSAVQVAVR